MPVGTVTARGASKAGKPTITIDGKLYYAGKTDLGGLVAGDKIEFSCKAFGQRGDLWGINQDWKLVEGHQKYPPTQGIPQNGASPSLGVPVHPAGAPVQDAERPAISNWIAAAIEKGLIDSPVDLLPWVRAAKEALREDSTFEGDSEIP